jgi:hypothetical protein
MENLKKFCSQTFLMFASATLGGFLSGHLWPSDSSAIAAVRHSKTVTAEKFVMVDSGGKQRGTMQVAEDGLSTLSLKDGSGKDRVELRVAAAGSAGLGFFDQNGHELAVFGEGADGSGLRIFGRQGKQVAALGSLPTGESSLTLYDANTGRARVGLGVAAKGEPALVLLDQNGADRAELSLRSDGTPGLALLDGKGKIIAGLPEIQTKGGSNQ